MHTMPSQSVTNSSASPSAWVPLLVQVCFTRTLWWMEMIRYLESKFCFCALGKGHLCVCVLFRHPEWVAAERKSCPALLDNEEEEAGPVPAICGVWAQCQTGVSLTYTHRHTYLLMFAVCLAHPHKKKKFLSFFPCFPEAECRNLIYTTLCCH